VHALSSIVPFLLLIMILRMSTGATPTPAILTRPPSSPQEALKVTQGPQNDIRVAITGVKVGSRGLQLEALDVKDSIRILTSDSNWQLQRARRKPLYSHGPTRPLELTQALASTCFHLHSPELVSPRSDSWTGGLLIQFRRFSVFMSPVHFLCWRLCSRGSCPSPLYAFVVSVVS
jgi:hypothetical protein